MPINATMVYQSRSEALRLCHLICTPTKGLVSLLILYPFPARKGESSPRISPSQSLLRLTKPNRHTINIATALAPNNAKNTTSNPASNNVRMVIPRIPESNQMRELNITKIGPFSIMKSIQLDPGVG